MNSEEQFTFSGSLRLPGASAQNVVAVCQQARFDPLAVLKAHIVGCDWAPFWQNNPFPCELEISSNAERGRLVLRQPTRTKMSIDEAEIGFAEWIRFPDDQTVLQGELIKVDVELAASGLLRDRRNTSYNRDGSVLRVQSTGDPDLYWTKNGRSWTLGIAYNNKSLAGDARGSVALVPCGVMRSEWRAEADTDLKQVMSALDAEIRDPTRLLSFVSRASTPWLLVTVHVIKKNGRRVCETATRRVTAKQIRTGWAGAMFSQEDAANCFARLLDHLAASSSRNDLTRAIDFVIASWCSENMKSALVLLHAALETIVSVVLPAKAAGRPAPSQFKKLEEKVRATIREFGASSGWNGALIEDLLEKSAEIKRPPIVRTICRLLPKLDIYTQDLWRDGVELESELRKAFAYRNRLVHAADAEETLEAQDRLFRLALLTERIILRVLGVKWLPPET